MVKAKRFVVRSSSKTTATPPAATMDLNRTQPIPIRQHSKSMLGQQLYNNNNPKHMFLQRQEEQVLPTSESSCAIGSCDSGVAFEPPVRKCLYTSSSEESRPSTASSGSSSSSSSVRTRFHVDAILRDSYSGLRPSPATPSNTPQRALSIRAPAPDFALENNPSIYAPSPDLTKPHVDVAVALDDVYETEAALGAAHAALSGLQRLHSLRAADEARALRLQADVARVEGEHRAALWRYYNARERVELAERLAFKTDHFEAW